MRSLILLIALVLPTGSAVAQPVSAVGARGALPGKLCANMKVQWADRLGAKGRVRNLGELPPGDLTLAVVREVDGCIESAVVGYDYGAVSPRQGRTGSARRRR